MAFFTDLFTRDRFPYSTKARWYKAVIVNDTLVSCDLPGATVYKTSSDLVLQVGAPEKGNIIDYTAIVDMPTQSTTRTLTKTIKVYASAQQSVVLATAATTYNKITAYVLYERK